jgi:hypothetical protein
MRVLVSREGQKYTTFESRTVPDGSAIYISDTLNPDHKVRPHFCSPDRFLLASLDSL